MAIDQRELNSALRQALNTGHLDGWALRAPWGNGGPAALDIMGGEMPAFGLMGDFSDDFLSGSGGGDTYNNSYVGGNNTFNYDNTSSNYFYDNTYHTEIHPPGPPDVYDYDNSVTNNNNYYNNFGKSYFAGDGLELNGYTFSVLAADSSIDVSVVGIKAVVIS